MTEEIVGTIFGIQHFSINDGPGIRTTVFMKGCPLRCLWCHNPESVSGLPVLSFIAGKCIGCGNCYRVCPNGAHKAIFEKHVVDRNVCMGCGTCAKECSGKALELVGRKASVNEVFLDVIKDMAYYEASNGGITLSGGEPMIQFDFTYQLLKKAKAEGLHCAVETSGFYKFDLYHRILPMVDLFLFDFKETDPKKHKEFTGVDNGLILENLGKLCESSARILLRCPVIPGLNDREDHFARIAELTKHSENLLGSEILAYHRLGISKAEKFGLDCAHEFDEPDAATVDKWRDMVRKYGGKVIT